MECTEKVYRLDGIGNVRFEFYLRTMSLTVEAWSNTRVCRISMFSGGNGRRNEFRLTEDQWWDFVRPIARSGFWTWAKRYRCCGASYLPSWSVSIMTTCGWYYSSGEGGNSEELPALLDAMVAFSEDIEARSSIPVRDCLEGIATSTDDTRVIGP